MPRSSTAHKADTVTFRLDPALKKQLTELAKRDAKSLGELMRELAQGRIEQERCREFEAEAHRQSLAIAERARDPNSDEAEVMRWIEQVADTEGWKE